MSVKPVSRVSAKTGALKKVLRCAPPDTRCIVIDVMDTYLTMQKQLDSVDASMRLIPLVRRQRLASDSENAMATM